LLALPLVIWGDLDTTGPLSRARFSWGAIFHPFDFLMMTVMCLAYERHSSFSRIIVGRTFMARSDCAL
jgi:hypothetical protein